MCVDYMYTCVHAAVNGVPLPANSSFQYKLTVRSYQSNVNISNNESFTSITATVVSG